MPELAIAAASTAQAYFSGSLITAGITTTTLTASLAIDFAVRATLGYALNALTTKPTSNVSRGYQNVNQLGTALPHQVVYGETVVGGAVFYQTLSTASVTDDTLHRCIAFAAHEIDSYQAVYLNGEELTYNSTTGEVTAPSEYAGNVLIKEHLGEDTQVADSDLVSDVGEWTVDHRAQGIAYLYVRFTGASNFDSGIPVITAKVRGKKVFDSRTSSSAWDDNPALCIRDYITSDIGLQEESSSINEALFEAAADVCEEDVSGKNRYTCNGSFSVDASPEDIIRSLLSSMGGTFWNYAGQWAVLAAEYQTPTLTLTEDDLRGPISVATKHSRRDNFNCVRGQYKGSETEYQPDDYTPVKSTLYISEDNGIEASTELNLLFTDTSSMAQRISRTFLRRNRYQQTVAGAFGLSALKLRVGDNVMLTFDNLFWNAKVFEVVDWRLGISENDIQVNMILREMDESVYTGISGPLLDESGNVLLDESSNDLEAIVA